MVRLIAETLSLAPAIPFRVAALVPHIPTLTLFTVVRTGRRVSAFLVLTPGIFLAMGGSGWLALRRSRAVGRNVLLLPATALLSFVLAAAVLFPATLAASAPFVSVALCHAQPAEDH